MNLYALKHLKGGCRVYPVRNSFQVEEFANWSMMGIEFMIIRFLQKRDVECVVRLHLDTLPDIGAQLGSSYLRRFYSLLVSHPEIHDCLVAYEENQLLAVLTATKNLHKTRQILKVLFSFSTILLIVKTVAAGKISPLRLFNRLIFELTLSRKGSLHPSIITFFVRKSYQRRGIGRALISDLLQRYKEKNMRSVYVDTRAENIKALNFYQNIGFKVKEEISDAVLLKYDLEKK